MTTSDANRSAAPSWRRRWGLPPEMPGRTRRRPSDLLRVVVATGALAALALLTPDHAHQTHELIGWELAALGTVVIFAGAALTRRRVRLASEVAIATTGAWIIGHWLAVASARGPRRRRFGCSSIPARRSRVFRWFRQRS